ncbi:transposase [Bradyrhizobium niftali]|uniref:transposase n=1 Tax=Bradyrhizobium niftali TaxID=2560055 RepID=UPI003833C3AC
MRYELSDEEWTAIRPMLPNKPRGVPRVNDRRVLNGIFWMLRSATPWRDLPDAFGPYTTCYNRFVRWPRAGVWACWKTLVSHEAWIDAAGGPWLRRAWANIPPKSNRSEPICFSPYLYRARNRVERFFNRIKQCRRVATRYDKLAANYLAFVQLASIRLWLGTNESTS